MKAIWFAFMQLLRAIRRDAMLLAACLAPLLFGLFCKFGVTYLEQLLTQYFKTGPLLAPYYSLLDVFFSMLPSVMLCFAAAMVMLEEADDHTAAYLFVTPLGRRGYLAARLGVPAAFAFAATLALLPLFRFTPMSFAFSLLLALAGTAQGLLLTLMVVSFAGNKLEGMALTKLASALMLGAAGPYFLKGSASFLLAPLPSYWIARAMQQGRTVPLLVALALSALWAACFVRRFRQKL